MNIVGDFGCSEEAMIVAAMSQIQNVFVTPTGQKSSSVSTKRYAYTVKQKY